MAVGQFFSPKDGELEFSPKLLLLSAHSPKVITFIKLLIYLSVNPEGRMLVFLSGLYFCNQPPTVSFVRCGSRYDAEGGSASCF